MKREQLTAVLEIGTSMTTLALGEIVSPSDVRMIAVAQTPSAGSVSKSRIADISNVAYTIGAVMREIESKSEWQVGSANLIVSGSHVAARRFATESAVEGGVVSAEKIEEVVEDARRAAQSDSARVCLHIEESSWRVDDMADVANPEGMSGEKLALDVLYIDADAARIADARKAANSARLAIDDCICAGVAASSGVSSKADRLAGTLFIDLGAGTTNWTFWHDDAVVAFGSIGVGSQHVTNDISHAFSCAQNCAENLKRQASAILLPERRQGRLEMPASYTPNEVKTISRLSLDTVVNARLRELFGIIRADLESKEVFHLLRGGVVLTGGGAAQENIELLAENVFGCGARIGEIVPEIDISACKTSLPPNPATLATVAGAFLQIAQNSEPEGMDDANTIWSRLSGLFTRSN